MQFWTKIFSTILHYIFTILAYYLGYIVYGIITYQNLYNYNLSTYPNLYSPFESIGGKKADSKTEDIPENVD